MIDGIDAKILSILQGNARVTNAEMARQLGMAPSAVLERVRRLEERGVILGYSPRLNPKVLYQGLLAFVFVRTREAVGQEHTGEQLRELPHVQEVHHITGEDCYLVKVRACDTDELHEILRDNIGSIRTVSGTRTTIVLETLKETLDFPICCPEKEGGS